MTITLNDYLKVYNCLLEIQAKAGKLVGGGMVVGLPYKKAFEVAVAIKNMKPQVDTYQDLVNKIGKDMGLQPVNGGAYYVTTDAMSVDDKNAYIAAVEDMRKTTLEYEHRMISFTDADLDGIELNISGASQQVFFDMLYNKK